MIEDQINITIKQYKTPFYIYDKEKIIENCTNLKLFSNNIKTFFSLKSNFNPELIKIIINSFDIGIETTSDFEYLIAKKLKCTRIIHNSIHNEVNIYKKIISNKIPINFDNIDAFEKFDKIENNEKYNCIIGFRVNFSLEKRMSVFFNLLGEKSKLGIDEGQIVSAYEKAYLMGYKRFGLFAMIASNILDSSFYDEFLDKLRKIMQRIENKLEFKFEYVDIGGGIGIDYQGDNKFDIADLNDKLIKNFSDLQIIIEPGRYLIGNAGYLVAKIISVKERGKYIIYIVDGGTNLFVRKAWFNQDHRITFIAMKGVKETNKESIIYGPLFDSKDKLAESKTLPKLNVGDYIIINDAGAYGSVRMSNFGTLPSVAEFLIEENTIRKISEEQTFDDFFKKFNSR